MTQEPTEMEVTAARAVIDRQRIADQKKETAELRKWLGRYFKYRNSYGGDHARWWLYGQIRKVGEHRRMTGLTFERTSLDNWELVPDAHISVPQPSGWQEITATEFWREAAKFARAVNAQLRRK